MQHTFHADISKAVKNRKIVLYFPLYYNLIYHEKDNLFEMEIVNIDGEIINISSKGKTAREIKNDLSTKQLSSSRYKNHYQLDFYSNDIALLTVNNFGYYELGEEETYLAFLAESFKTIAKRQSKYLFIDISQNTGGSDHNAMFLLDYLFDSDYKIFGAIYEKKISKTYINLLRKYNYTEHIRELKSAYSKYVNNTQHVMFYTFYERIKDVLHPFTGTIFLIQGDKTASAALTMSSAIRTSRRGLLIGDPTGEPANFYAEIIESKLPYSKLPIACAISHTIFSSGSSHDQWIEPDIYLDLDKTELNEQTLNNLIEQCKKEYPHFFKYTPNTKEKIE
jgi:C-terminal processing protease CtpA/Prc